MIYVPVATDPVSLSYDPAVAGQLAIPFSTDLRDAILIRLILPLGLYPIGNGLFQPAIISPSIFSANSATLRSNFHSHSLTNRGHSSPRSHPPS